MKKYLYVAALTALALCVVYKRRREGVARGGNSLRRSTRSTVPSLDPFRYGPQGLKGKDGLMATDGTTTPATTTSTTLPFDIDVNKIAPFGTVFYTVLKLIVDQPDEATALNLARRLINEDRLSDVMVLDAQNTASLLTMLSREEMGIVAQLVDDTELRKGLTMTAEFAGLIRILRSKPADMRESLLRMLTGISPDDDVEGVFAPEDADTASLHNAAWSLLRPLQLSSSLSGSPGGSGGPMLSPISRSLLPARVPEATPHSSPEPTVARSIVGDAVASGWSRLTKRGPRPATT